MNVTIIGTQRSSDAAFSACRQWRRWRLCCWPRARRHRPPSNRKRRCSRRRSPPKRATMSPAVLREHQRILAAYGGVYNDPRLQAMIEQTVERLVAASDRPDLHYKVTMLNSQSINAFALPTGQLYVTRGLVALANDESELASVLAHEMGHVIAHHAAIREEQASRRRWSAAWSAMSSPIRKPAHWRWPNRNSRWPVSRARRNSKPTPSASVSPRGPATIPMARCASSRRWSTIRS